MLCLGWNTRNNCKATDPIQVPGTGTPGQATTGVQSATAPCGDVSWFWVSLAGILGYSLVKKS